MSEASYIPSSSSFHPFYTTNNAKKKKKKRTFVRPSFIGKKVAHMFTGTLGAKTKAFLNSLYALLLSANKRSNIVTVETKTKAYLALFHAYTSIFVYLSTSAQLSLFLILLLFELKDMIIIQNGPQPLNTPIARRNKR